MLLIALRAPRLLPAFLVADAHISRLPPNVLSDTSTLIFYPALFDQLVGTEADAGQQGKKHLLPHCPDRSSHLIGVLCGALSISHLSHYNLSLSLPLTHHLPPSTPPSPTMSVVNVLGLLILDNPSPFSNPFQFEITFECLSELDDDLEWKVTYVGSAEDSTCDQVLDEVFVGPVPVGINKFVLQADAPDISQIPSSDLIGVTVVLVTCSYKEQEFCRVGYYVNNEYTGELAEGEEVPTPIDMTKVTRQILSDKPRVTRFPINWGLGTVVPGASSEDVGMSTPGAVDATDSATPSEEMRSVERPSNPAVEMMME